MELILKGIYKGCTKKISKNNKDYLCLEISQNDKVYNIPVFDEKLCNTSLKPDEPVCIVYNYSYKNNKSNLYVVGINGSNK